MLFKSGSRNEIEAIGMCGGYILRVVDHTSDSRSYKKVKQ